MSRKSDGLTLRQELFQAKPQEFKSESGWFLSLTIKLREKEANRELLCKMTIKINVNYPQLVSSSYSPIGCSLERTGKCL